MGNDKRLCDAQLHQELLHPVIGLFQKSSAFSRSLYLLMIICSPYDVTVAYADG